MHNSGKDESTLLPSLEAAAAYLPQSVVMEGEEREGKGREAASALLLSFHQRSFPLGLILGLADASQIPASSFIRV